MKTCSVHGCERKHHARGWCRIHYQNWKRNGVPEPVQEQFHGPIDARLRHYSKRDGGCLRWTAGHTEDGYGLIQFEGRNQRVHRVAYELAYGRIPVGYEVDHRCHVRDCLNPKHLRLLRHKQNAENRAGLRVNNTTGATGVFRRKNGRYQVAIGHHGRIVHAGTFDTLGEAAEVARLKRIELFTHNDIDRDQDDL